MQKHRNVSSFWLGIVQRFFGREELLYDEPMVPVVHTPPMVNLQWEYNLEERVQLESEMLLRNGYTAEEIQVWTMLRNRYQHGASDRGPLLRHLEFLKLLVQTGKIER